VEREPDRRRHSRCDATLKREGEGEILMYGSPTLMRTLAAHDLVDEYKI
jgi:hypothetical protein